MDAYKMLLCMHLYIHVILLVYACYKPYTIKQRDTNAEILRGILFDTLIIEYNGNDGGNGSGGGHTVVVVVVVVVVSRQYHTYCHGFTEAIQASLMFPGILLNICQFVAADVLRYRNCVCR